MANISGIERVYNLSPLQEGMLYHSVTEKNTLDYVVQTSMHVEGNLITELLETSVKLLSEKHDVLRSLIFYSKANRPKQVIVKDRVAEIVHFNLTQEEKNTQEERLDEIRKADLNRGFDLEKDSLLRITVVHVDENVYEMIWTFHHIIMDGWCLSLLYGDFIQFYNQLEEGKSYEAIREEIIAEKKTVRRYEDYINWLEKQDKEKGLQYWSEVLKDYDNDAKIAKSGINLGNEEPISEEIYTFSKELTENMKTVSTKYGVTISNIMESAWGILLQHYTRCKDVVFGKVVSGRNADILGIEQMVGLFINTIPERVRCSENMTVEELWEETKNQAIESGKYDYCSLAEVQSLTDRGSYLIHTLYVYENYFVSDSAKQNAHGLSMSMSENHEKTNYDITLSVSMSECVQLSILYEKSMYLKEDIKRILKQLETIVTNMLADTKQNVNTLQYMNVEEEQQIKYEFNKAVCNVPVEKTAVQMFEETVSKRSQHKMLVMEGESLTYEEVNKRVNRVAHTLRQQGVKPGDYVALLAHRSFEMIIGIFGIIKAGGAYVPIDPTYPKERICYILNDCRPKAVLTYKTDNVDYGGYNLFDLGQEEVWESNEENPEMVNTSEDIMYVIYTSGTTGNPKGVMIRHRNLVNLVYAYGHLYEMSENDTVLQFASIAFDQSVWDIFNITLLGGTLCLVPYDYITNPRRMEQYITENHVTIMALTPAYIRELEPKNLPYLKVVESGGAAADWDILKKWYRYMKVFNTYGPTEATVNATTYLLRGDEKNSIPIGSPIHNCQVYIINEYNQLCGIGCPGELCLTGAGISAGYLNRPELTVEKFMDNPFGIGKMYRTGDLAKWRFDGNIDYMGRIDEQVKIRGFRIELGEIEAVLLKQNGIKDAAVIARKDQEGESFIAAYFVADEEKKNIKILAEELRKVLPNYMIPAYFCQLDKIPLTKNGKLSVKELPEAEIMAMSEYKEPKTEIEKIIVQVFQEILLVKRVGMDDNFFELGGHSLRATRAVNMLNAQLECNVTVKDLFNHPTPAELAEMVENKKELSHENYERIPVAEKKTYYPMSSGQKRLFMVHEIEPQEIVYNMPGVLELGGDFSIDHLNNILNEMGKRHAVLRTRFGYENGEPVQYIEEKVEIEAEYEEMLGANAEDKKQLMEAFVRPFDLGKAPLLRVKLVKTGDVTNLLMFDMHHIICDGVSSAIIQEEFMTLFNRGTLEALERQYVDYSEWMNMRDLSSQKRYWIEQFQDEVPILNLPYDKKRPQFQSFRGKSIRRMLDAKTVEGVKRLAMKYEATEYMVYLSAYMMMLSRYSRQHDIVVGSPVSGRTHQDTERMVGMFVNMLPFRAKPEDSKLFSQFLLEVKKTCLKGYENQEYPFEDLIEEIDVQRNAARNPVFDVVFVMQNTEQKQLSLNHVMEMDLVQYESTVAKFDLTVTIDQMNGDYAVSFEYCVDLFYEDSIDAMMEHFIMLIEQLVEQSDRKLGDYADIDDAERVKLLETFNQTDAEYPHKTIVELFEEQVEQTPDSIAAVFGAEQITYKELNEKANVIARRLRECNIGRNDYVMLLTERSIELLIAMCAVFKAGAAYVPVDPDYPQERIEYMASDCKPKAILSTRDMKMECLKDIPVWNMKKEDFQGDTENLEIINNPEDGIYVIYTSGTTGRPKGVLISHKNVVRLFKNSSFYFDFGEKDVWLLFHYYGFDFSVWEIYGALLFGGKLCIPEKETVQNPKKLLQYIVEQGLTVLNQVPSAFYVLMDEMSEYKENSIRYLIFGGEALEPSKLISWHHMYPKVKIINMYGITETTVHVTYREITEKEMECGISDIGSAIPTLKVYIMDGMRLCGIGVPGELCVAGEGVARYYLNQPELTAQKFIRNPFGEGRLYRSGDLARWLPDGNLEYMGRIDQQVKVRGFRIELSEIANVIRNQDDVKDAVVVLKEDTNKEKYIMAYVISADGKPTDFTALKGAMHNVLPDYMLPSGFLNIDEIPLTANGKLNRKALPEIDFAKLTEYIEPKTRQEKLVAEIYGEVLKIEKVGANDNFFEIGGHSLNATRVLNLLETRIGTRLSLRDMLLYPVVRDFAKLLEQTNMQEFEPIPKATLKDRYLVSTAQRRLYIIQKMNPQSIAYNMPGVMELHGKVEISRIEEVFNKLVERHEVLRTVFEEDGDYIYQVIYENSHVEFEYEEVLNVSNEQKQEIYKQFIQPFSLQQGPLIRMKLVKLADEDCMMLFDIHHIIADGISLNILVHEFMEFYYGREVKENRIQYKDYSEWMNSKDLTAQKKYWLEKFQDEIPVLNLITDFKRPQTRDYRGNHITSTMPSEVQERIVEFASKTGTTEFMVLYSIWAMLLAEYGRTEDLIIGTPISGRLHPDIENIPGMFVNTLALWAKPKGDLRYLDYLQQIKETCLSAFENQEYPFDELAEMVSSGRDLYRNPIFDVMFTMQNNEQSREQMDYVSISSNIEEDERVAKFDLNLNITPAAEGYLVEWEYATSLFKKNSIALMAARFQAMVNEVLDNPEKKLCEYSGRVALDDEIEKKVNQTEIPYEAEKTVMNVFEDCVQEVPENMAIWETGRQLTYQQLNDRANMLAHHIIECGITKGDRVALVSKRSADLITAILAVIKVGGVYVPIDPEYPKARIDYMLEDCKPVLVMTDQVDLFDTTEIQLFDLNTIDLLLPKTDNLKSDITPDDLVYIIYTSGTTGKPKGVMIEHRGVVNLREYFVREQNMTTEDHVLQFASMAFDAMVSELCMSILTGATLYIVDDATRKDSKKFESYVLENKITAMILPPQFLAACNLQGKVRTIITAGSETNRDLVLKNGSIGRYSNDYGPTECTVCATHWEYQQGEELGGRIPIGKPIGNKKLYVMRGMERCPVMVPGELCVAGVGIARGYLHQDTLTKEKFIDNPFGEGKLYRTGDLVRLLENGNLEYLGRIDEQVKIRGYRVELPEIETVLKKQEYVTDAVVLAKEDKNGEKFISAYLVGNESALEEIKSEIRRELPDYMMPSFFTFLESIPVTVNGKTDNKKLLAIELKGTSVYEEAATEMEKLVAEIFMNILDLKKIGVMDNFFEIGGHSLRATRVINELESRTGRRMDIADFFSNPTIRGVAAYIEKMDEKEYIQIPMADQKSEYPMSPSQRRIFAVAKMDETNIAYNMHAAIEVTGNLTEEKVNTVFKKLVQRHELLRTRFIIKDGELIQKIEEEVSVGVEYFKAETMDEEMKKAIYQEFIRPFDLGTAPLMRIKLVKMEEHKSLLLFDMHHIISDGMSMYIIQKEFMALYNGESLEEQRVQYKDYSEWLRNQNYEQQKKYWLDLYKDEIPVLELPLDYTRPQVQSFEGRTLVKMTTQKLRNRVRKLASQTGATEYMILLAAFMVLLEKYSSQEDIVVGSPVSGRINKDMESMLGMFVNTLALRAKPERTKPFDAFLQEIKELCINANRNQAYSFDELVEELDVKREMSRNPLFDVMFVLQNNERAGFDLEHLQLEGGIETEDAIAKFDLTVNVDMADEEYRFSFEYCKALFDGASIARMIEHYMQIIKEITEHADLTIGSLKMVTEVEENLICQRFNDTSTQYNPAGKSVAQLFEECVENVPNKVAICCGEKKVTYQELNQKANRIAACMQSKGVKQGDFVAVFCDRKIETLYSILAVVKAGAVYVPIEADYPEERIRYILEDCKPAILLTSGKNSVSNLEAYEVLHVGEVDFTQYAAENLVVDISPEQLIYMIYTSGTTGKPKGCMVKHKSVIRLVKHADFLNCNRNTVILQTGAMSFDASTLELWGILLNEGRLILTEKEIIMNPVLLKQTILTEGVNTMFMTTALFNQMLDMDLEMFDSLEYLFIGGEKLSDQHVRKLKEHNKHLHFVNAYGPTENTTFTTTYEIPSEFHRIPIGKPISNTQVYILDGDQLCGIGVPGELCTAGEGIAEGYLNDEKLTNEKFVPNPFGVGKLYRTGDLARWLEDGTIEFLGRIDQQVKIRGFRIELAEIEQVLLKQPQIEKAVVIVRTNEKQEKYLVAFLVGEGDISTIQNKISRELPDYMIPAHMTFIPQLPVTTNGKLDVSALPDTVWVSAKEYVKPEGEKEEILVSICEEVLGASKIGMKDNFFELGGDSIKAIRLISRLREKGYALDVKSIMQEREIGGIAKYMEISKEDEYEQGEINGEVMLTPIQQEFFEWNVKKPEHFNQSIILKSFERIEIEALKETMKAVVTHHDILRAVYRDGRQIIRGSEEGNLYDLQVFDYRICDNGQEKAEEVCEKIQATCNLEEGPMVRVAVFQLEDADHILITIHHLVVDGVSWRILLEDIQKAYQMYRMTGAIELPKKTASFQLWSGELSEYAKSSRLLNEMKYWKEIKEKVESERRITKESENYDPDYVEIKLNQDDTENLLYNVNASYKTEINDILLVGLVKAISEIFGNQIVSVLLEGHGREELNKALRIDRTVGWFTSIYPVAFETKDELREQIIEVKETMRKVPNRGIGYGVLKYVSKKDVKMPVDITFNYLGDFRDQSKDSQIMGKSVLLGGSQIAKENRFGTDIIINGNVSGNNLVFEITYNKAAIDKMTIELLAQNYHKALHEIIGHCINMDEKVSTASDFGNASEMSEEEWAAMEELYSDIE